MAARAYRLHRHLLFWICVAGGALSLFAGVVAAVAAHNLFDGVQFGNRLEESLSDRRVAAYAAEALTEAFVRTNPDLVAARPLLVATSEGIVGSRPFRALAGRAAEQAHQAFFSSSAQSVVLSLPDVEVLVRSTLAQASPELAAKIPKGAAAALASVGLEGRTAVLVNVLQFGRRLSWISKTLLAAAPLLLLAAIWLAPRRRHGLVRVGSSGGSGVAGVVFAAAGPIDRQRGGKSRGARHGAGVMERVLWRIAELGDFPWRAGSASGSGRNFGA